MPKTWVTQAPLTPPVLARKQSDLSPWPQALSVAVPESVSEIQVTVTAFDARPPPVSVQVTGAAAPAAVGLFRFGFGLGSQLGVKSDGLNGSSLLLAGPGANA